MKKGEIVTNTSGIYILLQDPYFDITLDGEEILKAESKEYFEGEHHTLAWPIKNDSYNRKKFYLYEES